ncbi:Liver carboxylesterase [Fusarium oxysporum f. sp. cubense race 1]|uniref:Liver carboxylesterase n=1 Tax=Fusarium oxysporum f. sp. cubense (strain race 1) TaxID=1229664 RepID=N4UQP9_FUSC1|nr:Liver carboxylesterase [Fusarium oxysporum f. sp. cubense race 1]
MILSTLVLCCFLVFVEARSLPFLKLPYGTWQASSFDEVAKVYTFKNVRYGAPPIGNRRFAKPEPPEAVSGIQDGSKGAACIQLHTSGTDINTRDESVIPDYSKIIQASLSKKVYSEGGA